MRRLSPLPLLSICLMGALIAGGFLLGGCSTEDSTETSKPEGEQALPLKATQVSAESGVISHVSGADADGGQAVKCTDGGSCAKSEYCAKKSADCNGLGVCKPKPLQCIQVVLPVCGCDGVTYNNQCAAAAVGVNVHHEGECRHEMRRCRSKFDCARSEFCDKEPGDCHGIGVCEPRPQICTREYAPVCGCDGVTYSNPCAAASHGASVDYQGECRAQARPCRTKFDCARSEYCDKTPGDCDGSGVCEARPQICTREYAPVCGCDGETYNNACEAASYGASVNTSGPCATEPVRCQDNSECNRSEYCEKAPGDCHGSGVCELRPEVCTREYAPVCGCDGRTYGNRCEAARHGVNLDYWGECRPHTNPCRSKFDCARSEFCDKDPGDCDGAGVCEPRPQMCTTQYAPVCGCDEVTYSNACVANHHGASVYYLGPCETGPVICRDNGQCNRSEFCGKREGDCLGTGVCELRPEYCTMIYAPVCGCDGNTYGNHCVANHNGINLQHIGECRSEVERVPVPEEERR